MFEYDDDYRYRNGFLIKNQKEPFDDGILKLNISGSENDGVFLKCAIYDNQGKVIDLLCKPNSTKVRPFIRLQRGLKGILNKWFIDLINKKEQLEWELDEYYAEEFYEKEIEQQASEIWKYYDWSECQNLEPGYDYGSAWVSKIYYIFSSKAVLNDIDHCSMKINAKRNKIYFQILFSTNIPYYDKHYPEDVPPREYDGLIFRICICKNKEVEICDYKIGIESTNSFANSFLKIFGK